MNSVAFHRKKKSDSQLSYCTTNCIWPYVSQYIKVRKLFKGGNYSRKYGILNFLHSNPLIMNNCRRNICRDMVTKNNLIEYLWIVNLGGIHKNIVKLPILTRLIWKHMQAFSDCLWRKFRSLCNVTFWQKVDFLINNAHLSSSLYGI